MSANNDKEASTPEEQLKLLEEANAVVKTQAFQMKRCLDNGKLMDALKHCSNMLGELRTGMLSPKYYYELYVHIFDELRHLEAFLVEEHKRGKRLSDLYELVQYAGNILPRLYLLVTVGAVYIETKEAPTKDILIDMVEMCRGVQHPTRGLFLRNYLSQMTKNKLPDVSTPHGEQGSVQDSIQFVLTNFIEMNKLWVRMQHQGLTRERERREKERRELRILVGTNLERLSKLEGVDLATYQKLVLPNVLDQVVSCKDSLAQEYLMEVIIQVFYDELHLRTLEPFLEACSKLQKSVNVKNIIITMIDRLARYATTAEGGIPKEIALFEIFSKQIKQLYEARPDMIIQDVLALQVALLNLSTSCYPDNFNYVDQILSVALDRLKSSPDNKALDKTDSAAGKQLIRLLSIPIEQYQNVLTVLDLDNYAAIPYFLSYEGRKNIATQIVESLLRHNTVIQEAEQANKLLELISSLVKDEDDQPSKRDEDDFDQEQTLVARMVHLFHNSTSDKQYQLLLAIRKHFGAGGDRIRYTLPPLVISSLRLALRYEKLKNDDENWTKKCQKVFQYSHQTTSALVKAGHHEISLRLFLQCAQAADICEFETIAYEFVTQALLIYEENISDSKAQLAAISLIIGTLQTMRVFGPENHDTVTTKCALYASRLLKKPDQCLAVQLCSHLFWAVPSARDSPSTQLFRDGKRVLECLQKSLKIADTCMEQSLNVQLFVEILNRYLYYFDKQNEAVTLKYVNGLIDLINTNVGSMDNSEQSENIIKHFKNSLAFIQFKKEHYDGQGPSYSDIDTSALSK